MILLCLFDTPIVSVYFYSHFAGLLALWRWACGWFRDVMSDDDEAVVAWNKSLYTCMSVINC